jgi:hypothetical protein
VVETVFSIAHKRPCSLWTSGPLVFGSSRILFSRRIVNTGPWLPVVPRYLVMSRLINKDIERLPMSPTKKSRKRAREMAKQRVHQDKAVRMGDEVPDICILCGSDHPKVVGQFIPEGGFKHRLGVPVGKTRIILYSLCGRCFSLPDKADRVEDAILGMQVGLEEGWRCCLAVESESEERLSDRPNGVAGLSQCFGPKKPPGGL